MQKGKDIQEDYIELLQILQERWKRDVCENAKQLGISPSKASRILNGKQECSFELLDQMAAIVGLTIRLQFDETVF